MLKVVGALAALAMFGFAGYLVSGGGKLKTIAHAETPTNSYRADAAPSEQLAWVAAAPGRVEPRSGEMKVGTAILGRVAEVLVRVNDVVEEGELLFRLDDEEVRARLAAAEAEAGARKRERDAQAATSGREDIRTAEDGVFSAGRALTGARFELDYALIAKRSGHGTSGQLQDARRRLSEARDRLQRERIAYAKAQAKANLPAPNRIESALSAARAEVEIAEATLDKTRIRAPAGGTILQLHARLGEIVAPAAEQPLVFIGDMSVMRVKAEVEEGDVSKIKVGQRAFVKSQSYPGREFEGRVSALAPSLAPPRIGLRGPRRATDVEVLEATIELDGNVPLLPGMRADAFFRRNN